MVEYEHHVNVGQHVTTDTNDTQQPEPTLKACETTNGERPENVLSVAGY